MNTSGIEGLLEKFYDGNTSLQEEQTLRDFFRRQDIPAHLKMHQPLFNYYGNEQRQEINTQDFDQKQMGRFTEEPAESPVVRIHQNQNRFVFIAGIAASIMLVIGLIFTFQNDVFNRSAKIKATQKQLSHMLMQVRH